MMKLISFILYLQMEGLVREMQDADNGVPVRSQKIFLTSIPSAFMGKSHQAHHSQKHLGTPLSNGGGCFLLFVQNLLLDVHCIHNL